MPEVYALVIGSFSMERADRGKLPVRYRREERVGREKEEEAVERCETRLEINLSLPVGLNRIYFRSCNFSGTARGSYRSGS